jgi:hypothetical protein
MDGAVDHRDSSGGDPVPGSGRVEVIIDTTRLFKALQSEQRKQMRELDDMSDKAAAQKRYEELEPVYMEAGASIAVVEHHARRLWEGRN